MNAVILYLKEKYMINIKSRYELRVGRYNYGQQSYPIILRRSMTGYLVHRDILKFENISFSEYEKRLTDKKVKYKLTNSYCRYDFDSKEDAEKAIDILYDMLFILIHSKEKE